MVLAILLSVLQERKEDNSWLRYKPGTWIKSKLTIEGSGRSGEDVQTLTLKEVDGDEYVVEESYATPGSMPSLSRRSRGVKTGTETITAAGQSFDCTVTLVKGRNDQGPTEGRFWTPKGSRNAVKITFKQKDAEGELLATAVDEKIQSMGRTLLCNRLKGKVQFGPTEGSLSLVLSEDIPGSQVSAELLRQGPDGKVTIRFEAVEIHEEKEKKAKADF